MITLLFWFYLALDRTSGHDVVCSEGGGHLGAGGETAQGEVPAGSAATQGHVLPQETSDDWQARAGGGH